MDSSSIVALVIILFCLTLMFTDAILNTILYYRNQKMQIRNRSEKTLDKN